MVTMKKSYIMSQYKVSKTSYQLIHGKLQGLLAEEKRFFLHILCSQLIDLAKGLDVSPGWDTLGLNLPSKTLRAEFGRHWSWEKMEPKMAGLLEGSDFAKGECRYFQVFPPLFEEIRTHLEEQLLKPDGSPAVNLFDGNAYNVAHAANGQDGARSTKLMRDAMRVLHATECSFNVDAIHAHLEKLKASNDPAYENDRLCAQTMFAGMKREGKLGLYIPSYSPQTSGRIGEVGGGLQSCTKAMKHAAFTGIENIHNYDLQSAHGYVLLQELKLAGIDGAWVENHLGKGVFEQRASALNLPKRLYKKLFFATINGASHHWKDEKTSRKKPRKREKPGAIQEELLDHFKDVQAAREKFGEVVAALKPLKKIVEEYRTWLLSPTCPHRKKTERREYILNAAGQELPTSHEEFEQKVIANILQGRESAFIHHLTILSKKHSFTVVSNQHDGLVTLGKIPDEAKVEAGKLSGFEQPFLDIKAFV